MTNPAWASRSSPTVCLAGQPHQRRRSTATLSQRGWPGLAGSSDTDEETSDWSAAPHKEAISRKTADLRRPARHAVYRPCCSLAISVDRGSRSRLSATALSATITLEPDMEIAPTSGRRTKPSGCRTPAASGIASEL
jgi:hypothetical protein